MDVGKTIFVAETDPQRLARIKTTLEAAGYRVVGSTSVEKASDSRFSADLYLINGEHMSAKGEKVLAEVEASNPVTSIVISDEETRLDEMIRRLGPKGWDFISISAGENELLHRVRSCLEKSEERAGGGSRERGLKGQEARILHSQKMEALGTLAGGIAHEFNNLLQIIQGYAELLHLDKGLHQPAKYEIEEIRGAARRAADLTQQLLTFSRRLESAYRPVDLNEEILKSVRVLEPTELKTARTELRLEEGLKLVSADPNRIHEVLVNLLLNSRDALPADGKIVIQTQNVTLGKEFCDAHVGIKPGEHVLLRIADNGSGMNAEVAPNIFDPFFTTKKVGQGVGLGLSIVYGIVKNHNGYIECRSTPGKGTVFDIYLPVITSAAELTPENGQLPLFLEQSGKRTETILFVDDEPTLRKLGIELLSKFGYTVLPAVDSEQALRLFREKREQIQLVVLDLIMPGKSGEWCLQEILKIKPDQKVIVASGYASNTTVTDILRTGASKFLKKPYRLRELLSLVRETLNGDL